MEEKSMAEYQKIGARIREIRISKGMSQADLAASANISLPHISEIEHGKTKMLLATFIRVAEALQVSADVLLRPDIPEVKNIYQSEFADLLQDCSPVEIEAILKVVAELKAAFRTHREKMEE